MNVVMDEWGNEKQVGGVVESRRIISNNEWLTCGQQGVLPDQPK